MNEDYLASGISMENDSLPENGSYDIEPDVYPNIFHKTRTSESEIDSHESDQVNEVEVENIVGLLDVPQKIRLNDLLIKLMKGISSSQSIGAQDVDRDEEFHLSAKCTEAIREGMRSTSAKVALLSGCAHKDLQPFLISDKQIIKLVVDRLGLTFADLAHRNAANGIRRIDLGTITEFADPIDMLVQSEIPCTPKMFPLLSGEISNQFASSCVRQQLSGSWGEFNLVNSRIFMSIDLEKRLEVEPARATVRNVEI